MVAGRHLYGVHAVGHTCEAWYGQQCIAGAGVHAMVGYHLTTLACHPNVDVLCFRVMEANLQIAAHHGGGALHAGNGSQLHLYHVALRYFA